MWQWTSTDMLIVTIKWCCQSYSFEIHVEGVELDTAAYRDDRLQEGVVRPWPAAGAKRPRKRHDIIVYRVDELRTTKMYRWATTGHHIFAASIGQRICYIQNIVYVMMKPIVQTMTRELYGVVYKRHPKKYPLWWKTNVQHEDLDTFTNPLPSTRLSNPSLWLSLRSASEHRINRVWAG